jgi:molybdopterin/thiamine biosynthesis adenylyltransferase
MTVTLVLTTDLEAQIADAASEPLETAGVLLANLVVAPNGDLRLLGQKVAWVQDGAYLTRERHQLLIASEGYVPALGEAETGGMLPIWLHTHPGEDGVPLPSRHDHTVDRQLADLFRLRSGAPFYGALIVSPRGRHFAFSGSLHPDEGPVQPIERLWQVGEDWRLSRSVDAVGPKIPPLFDRSVRAFGAAIQGALGDLRVGVVGAGGTGSAVSEQLVRLGVRHLTLIDVDTLSETNVTRVYGSTPGDVGRPKVEVLRDHLHRIAPDLNCSVMPSMLTLEATARQLAACDVVFGCTDDNAGRLVLSRVATYLLTPVIDVGVLLSSDAGGLLASIDGRVTTLTPGAACLVCRDRIDLARAAQELRTPDERKRLEEEGYAPSLGGGEPAVVAFTTSVAAAGVAELLERLIGYGPKPRPTEVLLRWHEREISTNTSAPRAGHYCDPASGKWGQGGASPFLGQVWPQA